MKKQESNDKSSKKNISTNVVERSKPTGIAPRSIGIGNDITAYKDPSDKYSYPSNTISRGGEGGKGGQWGYSGSNSGQIKINPQVAKQITDKINASESAIQNEIGRLKGLNPIASEETLRSAAIQFLGIATVELQRELEAYQKEQETGLAVNVAQKITPYVLSLNSGEWSLGIHTASSEGRKSKDSTYGLSNQVMICLEHLRINGGADKLKVLTFTECDLTTSDMIYFGNTMLQYPLLLKYLDFSYNRIGDIGTISFINSFVTSPTGKYPMHHIINLNLSNNAIGDDGAAHIAAYVKYGHMPSLKVLHLEGNKFTKTGEGFLVKALDSISQNLKIVLAEVKGFSKDALKEAIKGMLFVAKNNGISTKETLTNDETIEYCKKGIPNVALNIGWGVTKCLKTPAKYLTPKDVTFQDVIVDTMSNIKEVKALMTFYCITQSTFFSIVDEDFANCLTGVDSMLND